MGQCRAGLAGPRELDLGGHGGAAGGGRRGRRGASVGSVGLYRPTSSWVRNGATGGGRFGSGAHDGERAERQRRGAWRGCRGGSGSGLGRVWARGCAKGRARWRGEASSGPFGRGRAVDEVHRRRTAGGGRNRASREREMEMGALL